MTEQASPAAALSDATLAAALFAIDPGGTGGVVLRSGWGPARDDWFVRLQGMLPKATPIRRVPPNVTDDRLLGGLDLAATLQAKRPIVERGLLAEADGGLVVLPMAERLTASTVAHLTSTLDLACVVVERDGIAARPAARLGLIAFDEGVGEDEGVARALLDRLAFHVGLAGNAGRGSPEPVPEPGEIERARRGLADVVCDETVVAALCEVAMALGIDSLRAPLLAVQVARASAALEGRTRVDDGDAAIACRLVLAPRATRLPSSEAPAEEQEERTETPNEAPDETPPADDDGDEDESPPMDQSLVDMILTAAKAAMPAQILASLEASRAGAPRKSTPGKAGAVSRSTQRGRPAGVRRGDPRGRSKINVIETLRAAAPWQTLRRAARAHQPMAMGDRGPSRLEVRRDDFRITRFKQHAATTTIFVVDASGSSAANRLAEAKGAVELLLADCYVRRDEVALIAFRGNGAEIILPPTRSLVRAKRCLAGLPGGGATPLAAALDMAGIMAGSILRKGQSPVVVLLTDGKANMTRDGRPGAALAGPEATVAARAFRVAGVTSLVVDTSPRPRPPAEQLARDMGALYLPLPYAGSKQLSDAIQVSVAGALG
ncbi:magnesium chelatase subunit D [soil metagenome]